MVTPSSWSQFELGFLQGLGLLDYWDPGQPLPPRPGPLGLPWPPSRMGLRATQQRSEPGRGQGRGPGIPEVPRATWPPCPPSSVCKASPAGCLPLSPSQCRPARAAHRDCLLHSHLLLPWGSKWTARVLGAKPSRQHPAPASKPLSSQIGSCRPGHLSASCPYPNPSAALCVCVGGGSQLVAGAQDDVV